MSKVVVIGAGPAGLTAAFELLSQSSDYEVVVLEESQAFGGISRTVAYHGNRMDMGGHRFFSKVPEVNAWWERFLPLQGAPAADDRLLGREVPLAEGGPDPQKTDRVMLTRHRVSRILFDGKWFDYPISLTPKTLKDMGLLTTLKVGFSYLGAQVHKLPEDNLENFYINRFGRRLYEMFFEDYTENLWGRHPREIDASWGAQRTKGLSIAAVVKDVFGRMFKLKGRNVETSLIEEFKYPKLGPGELWEVCASEVEAKGGRIEKGARATRLLRNDEGMVTAVIWEKLEPLTGEVLEEVTEPCDVAISSMPIKDLVAGMDDVPKDPARIASGLPYRDYMTLGVLVDKLALKNETDLKTVGDIVPDEWVYVQDRSVRMGRFQVFNNWSPYLVQDLEHTVWVGLEYFCNEGDDLWSMDEKAFSDLGIAEMVRIGLIEDASHVKDTHMERVKKAYPAYFDTYDEMDTLVAWLKTIPNLYCVGRNGQHRYNNLDHSMMTSFEAVKNILAGATDASNVWAVNTERKYHETDASEPPAGVDGS